MLASSSASVPYIPYGSDPAVYEQVVRDVRAGRSDAIERLYNTMRRGIRIMMRRVAPDIADDFVHDVFLDVVNAIRNGDVREPKAILGFTRTIAQRKLMSHIATRCSDRPRVIYLDADVRAETIGDLRTNTERDLIAQEQIAIAQRALADLDERDREILRRFYLAEQTQETICREMHLTETQFRLLKSRAKAKFAEHGKRIARRTGLFRKTACA